jgi:UDP-GlcNAc:undecaprenyl-phosphate GlcNAc-1-phosphate transferase
MTQYMMILVGALTVALGTMPVVRRAAVRWGFIAVPDSRRVHTRPTPLLGGVAIYLGCIVALLAFGDRFYVPQVISMLVGATLMSFLGIWDDHEGLRSSCWVSSSLLGFCTLLASRSVSCTTAF